MKNNKQLQKYIPNRSLKEYELKQLYDDYIPMSSYDNRMLATEEYAWRMEHGFAQKDFTHFTKRK